MFQILPQHSLSISGRTLPCFPLIFTPLSSLFLPLSQLFQNLPQLLPITTHPYAKRHFRTKPMASEIEVLDISSVFERIERNRDMSLFLPFLYGFSGATPRPDSDDPDGETGSSEGGRRPRIILVNPFTQGMVVIDGAASVEALFRELASEKGGRPPASKESIDGMPSVEIGEGCDGLECVVCLEEFGVGGVAKEMPCKHRFHPSCIEKWLGIHGSCPVCRYEMPVEEREEEGGETRRRGGGGEVWVSFSFNRSRRGQEHDQAASGDSNDDSSSSHGDNAVDS